MERHVSPRGDAFERDVRVSRRDLTAGMRVARVDGGVAALDGAAAATTTLLVEGYDEHGNKRHVGGESAGIVATIANKKYVVDHRADTTTVVYVDRQTATVEDLGTGNYLLAFAPGKRETTSWT